MLLQAEARPQAPPEANVESRPSKVYERTTPLRGSAALQAGPLRDLADGGRPGAAERRPRPEARASPSAATQASQRRATARKNATIRAPFDGVVVARLAGPGDYLQAGSPVLRIIDDLTLEVEADVPTEIVAGLDPGDAVSAIVDDGTVARAIVRAVVPSESPATRTRPVRFTIDVEGTTKPLAAGQSVILRAPVGPPREALSVAKDALVQQSGGWIVFVAEDGKATPRRVTIGAAAGGRFEVQGDLEAGELVVVRGNERLRPGQDIAYEAPAAAVASDAAQATGERATN